MMMGAAVSFLYISLKLPAGSDSPDLIEPRTIFFLSLCPTSSGSSSGEQQATPRVRRPISDLLLLSQTNQRLVTLLVLVPSYCATKCLSKGTSSLSS
jgi:hypothetical protein